MPLKKKLPPILKKLLQPPASPAAYPLPPLPILPVISPPLPTISVWPPCNRRSLVRFLEANLVTQPLTPQRFLHFLKSKLHHHPLFTHYDFHIFNWASTVDSFRHDHSTLEWMARILALTHRLTDLTSLLAFISSNPCQCTEGIFSCPRTEPIFQFAINAYCKAGKLDDAVVAFRSLKKLIDGRPAAVVYNILIHGFVKCRQHDKVLETYHGMLMDRVKPDVFTFNTLLCSCCKNGMLDMGLKLFREMREMGCAPNVITFNTLIMGFLGNRRFEEGINMAYEMIDSGHKLSTSTCEILIDGFLRGDRVREAHDLLIDFSKRRVLPVGFDSSKLINILCYKGEPFLALEFMEELWSHGHVPSLICCTTLVEGLRKHGKVESALRLMEKMLKQSIVPDIITFNCLLEDLCCVGLTANASCLTSLASTRGLDPDELTYNILVFGYTKERKRIEGEVLVEEMLDKNFIPDILTYNRLMDGLSKTGTRRKC